MEVVRKHAFTPQWAAQSLRIRRTQTIGFAVPNLTNGFFGQIAMTIDAHFRQARYSTLICFTAKNYQNELESLGSLVSKNVDGIIFAPSGCGGRYLQDLPQLREKPLVLIDNACENLDGWCVLHDNRFGLKLLADHLVERGYRRIAFIGGPLEESSAAERLAGYREALRAHGLEPAEELDAHRRLGPGQRGLRGHARFIEQGARPGPRPSCTATRSCCWAATRPSTAWVCACPRTWRWPASTRPT